MAVDIKSAEFANAWRIVSEALLAHIQGGNINIPAFVSEISAQKGEPVNITSQPQVQPVAERKVQDVKYAACPIRQIDGSYILKNLKDERQQESTYKITRYTDGTCEFELCDLQDEARQIFKDNKADRMPSSVGTSIGEITADNRIVNLKPGKGIIDGRSVKITEALEVKFE